ncbi:hypothetical protein [Microcoleus sp. B3-A4]|uniref:hypothetical protein n=1 Tax=Microcoleus sp. B3-A4 TaxID=2818653 RepID=UPI002FD45B6E
MIISQGQIFKVVSSIDYKNGAAATTNTGWVTTDDHEPGIKLPNRYGYLVVAEASAIQNIEICPNCCLLYGKTFNKCTNHVFTNSTITTKPEACCTAKVTGTVTGTN